ncbi:MAG: sodium-dependent transporter, partial [Candidatus Neomarinimicrobiota bacterium]
SILEVVTAYFIDEKKWGRTRATVVFGGVIAVVGSFASLSLGGTNVISIFGELSFFDLLDKASSKYMLPIGGLLTAVFVLVRWGVPAFMEELGLGESRLGQSPRLVTGIVMTATVLVGIVLLNEAFGIFG